MSAFFSGLAAITATGGSWFAIRPPTGSEFEPSLLVSGAFVVAAGSCAYACTLALRQRMMAGLLLVLAYVVPALVLAAHRSVILPADILILLGLLALLPPRLRGERGAHRRG